MGLFSGLQQQMASHKNRKIASRMKRRGEKGLKEAYDKRTDYTIPDEIRANVQAAQNEAYGKPALQQYMEDQADQELAGNLSNVNRYATSSADALAYASGATQQARVGKNQAAVAGQQVRQQNMQNLYDATNELANYKSMAWDINVNVPFLQRLKWSQDLIGAGYQGAIDANNQYAQGSGETYDSFFGMATKAAGF